jgi:hypothetical protein
MVRFRYIIVNTKHKGGSKCNNIKGMTATMATTTTTTSTTTTTAITTTTTTTRNKSNNNALRNVERGSNFLSLS